LDQGCIWLRKDSENQKMKRVMHKAPIFVIKYVFFKIWNGLLRPLPTNMDYILYWHKKDSIFVVLVALDVVLFAFNEGGFAHLKKII